MYPPRPIGFDPGIPGFVKAARHPSGAALVMTTWERTGQDWLGLFWVTRLIHNAVPVAPQHYRMLSERTLPAVERHFDYLFLSGPPPLALRDSQKQRVYTWEDDNIFPWNDAPMTWAGCHRFLNHVWDRVGTGKAPKLTQQSRAQKAMSFGGQIHLPESSPVYRSRPIILHELSHELNMFDAHGRAFVRTYIDMSARFLGINRLKLEHTARQYGVTFN
jgi:hypothetical protein